MTALQFEDESISLIESDGIDPSPDMIDGPIDKPDADFVKQPKRPLKATRNEKKVAEALNLAMRGLAAHPATVPDAAAIIMHGPDLAKSLGDLAAHDARVEKMINFLDSSTNNPYLAVTGAALPLILQVLRNHEPTVEPTVRVIKIGRREIPIKFRLGVKLGFFRDVVSNDPKRLTDEVFGDPAIRAALERTGVKVAKYQAH